MPRQTEKYTAGLTTWQKTLKKRTAPPHAELYSQLEAQGYFWQDKKWTDKPKSTSIFKDDEGAPTGVIRLRVMGNTADIDNAIAGIKKGLNIIETSDPYPNRKGAGYRVYLTVKL